MDYYDPDGGVGNDVRRSYLRRLGAGLGIGAGAAYGAYKHSLDKGAAQDNSKPQRSATGESEGLSYQHKPDHDLQGRDAWASVGSYCHKKLRTEPDPFKGRHQSAVDSRTLLAGLLSRLTLGRHSLAERLARYLNAPAPGGLGC